MSTFTLNYCMYVYIYLYTVDLALNVFISASTQPVSNTDRIY